MCDDDGKDDDGSNAETRAAVRLNVQEIITCQVVLKDIAQRDRLIKHAVGRHGHRVGHCVLGFISANAFVDVTPEVAENRFFFVLLRLGQLCELLAEVEGVPVAEIVASTAQEEWVWGRDGATAEALTEVGHADAEVAEQQEKAMRVAQTCLIAHHFVRRGSRPWGIQQSLDLNDMCVVVEMLQILLLDLVDRFEEQHHEVVVRTLLEDVGTILRAMASSRGMSVSGLVSDYFVYLARRDVG